jgi:hypothetical protein
MASPTEMRSRRTLAKADESHPLRQSNYSTNNAIESIQRPALETILLCSHSVAHKSNLVVLLAPTLDQSEYCRGVP